MIIYFIDYLFGIAGFLFCALLVARLLRQHSNPSVSFAWILAIILIPYAGVPAYLLFGGRKMAKRIRKKGILYRKAKGKSGRKVSAFDASEGILMSAMMPPSRHDGCLRFIPDGTDAYATLVKLLESAKQTIDVTTFILSHDEVGRALVDLLAKKAGEGVKVRLLLDALGSFRTRGSFVQGLRAAGGEVAIFMPVLPLRRKWSANLRNHRKIVIVDGRSAIIGGMNLGEDYMGPSENPNQQIDSAVLLEGSAVQDVGEIFETDWSFATGVEIEEAAERPTDDGKQTKASAVVQIAASGPDVPDDPVREAVLSACFEARERLWIVTPYFVPDESIARAILVQAHLGRDVRMILPKKSDHYLADIARGPFLRRMHESGVKIFLYPGTMVHAKHIIFDKDLALAGSMNLDMRSLYLNYEVAAFIRSRDEVETIAAWIQKLSARCEAYVETEPSYVRGWIEDLSLLVSPLL